MVAGGQVRCARWACGTGVLAAQRLAGVEAARKGLPGSVVHTHFGVGYERCGLFGSQGNALEPVPVLGRRGPIACGSRDRKSTRLNSSHVAISYAVFCLNKNMTKLKNKQED